MLLIGDLIVIIQNTRYEDLCYCIWNMVNLTILVTKRITLFDRFPCEGNESQFVTQKTDVYSFGIVIWESENALCQPADTPSSQLAPYCHEEYENVGRFLITVSYKADAKCLGSLHKQFHQLSSKMMLMFNTGHTLFI